MPLPRVQSLPLVLQSVNTGRITVAGSAVPPPFPSPGRRSGWPARPFIEKRGRGGCRREGGLVVPSARYPALHEQRR